MGNSRSEFVCIEKDGAPLSPNLIALSFPEFKQFVQTLVDESKGVAKGKTFSYSIVKDHAYDTVLNYQKQDAIVFACKKVEEDEFITYIYVCKDFHFNVNLEFIKKSLSTIGVESDRVLAVLKKFERIRN